MNWDDYFVEMALHVAKRSKDASTKLGSVIVGPDNEIRSTGYNSFVRGINDYVPFRQTRPEKYFWFEHSERNAIYNAARVGIPLKGCRIYLTPGPGICADCARAIIQVGIIEVVMPGILESENQSKWTESSQRGMAMFKEAGVLVRGL